jgi:hypothetical protein
MAAALLVSVVADPISLVQLEDNAILTVGIVVVRKRSGMLHAHASAIDGVIVVVRGTLQIFVIVH